MLSEYCRNVELQTDETVGNIYNVYNKHSVSSEDKLQTVSEFCV